MLFQDQREKLTGEDHDLYFAGAAIIKQGEVAFVTGARTRTEPREIITSVEYINTDGTSKQSFNKVFDAVDFERFLNTFAMKVSTITKGSAKLVELDHRFTAIGADKFDLTDQEKNAALYTFLIQLVTGNTKPDAARAAGLVIKTHLKQKA